ncbi:hypothetical protein [Leisingera sp. S232]|uniref:hypothetical protein n=1 Tax=Leisingera sp. S232 TaxID=3415132 RepID=UPI003C7995EC
MALQAQLDRLEVAESKVREAVIPVTTELEQRVEGFAGAIQALKAACNRFVVDAVLSVEALDDVGTTAPFAFGDGTSAQVKELEGAIVDLDSAVEATHEKLEAALEMCDDFSNGLATAKASAEEVLTASVEAMEGAFEELATEVIDNMSALDERCNEAIKTLAEDIREVVEGKIEDELSCLVSNTRERLETVLSDDGEDLEAITDALGEHLETSVRQLAENIDETAEEKLEALKAEVLEMLEERIMAEMTDSVLGAQINAQIAALLQPYLPQLMVANAMAPAIQNALNVMRMGI